MNISPVALSGLNQAEAKFDLAAAKIETGEDLPADVVSLMSAKTGFELNLKVLKVADEMDRHTLDLLA